MCLCVPNGSPRYFFWPEFWSLVPFMLLVMKTVLCREEQAYLVGVAGLKDVTGHLGLGVVGLAPQEIGKIGEVIAVVNEARDELCFVLENEN